jgi:UDP-3-O-acyl-N-acetylglucosamine deacetylase
VKLCSPTYSSGTLITGNLSTIKLSHKIRNRAIKKLLSNENKISVNMLS